MFIYVTFDSNGFVTDYKKVETDGYTRVFVLDSWINQFAQYPDKFRYDSTNQKLLNPGNLPDISLNTLNQDFTKLQTTVQNSQAQIQGMTESGTQSAAALTALAQSQSSLASEVQQALASVTALAKQNTSSSTSAANSTNTTPAPESTPSSTTN
ncbi:hypothetical protein [Lentilactobacillus hilgardii]|uniref:Uncharacterized protein n=1 Tax=Lentilactobacillus hilgardii (strain ATCC 8290 / DSM 20176 / CCUG 30140 / JCM 1155 / KCTC 3500 / NBRC 15886 / NCIMB 8040 / NRRL B-1843 / 9) TaxID=1423757 RepID=C0XFP2_LENH9|nr:hypothetical protein [Lentilactobacillus hilgardii]EEI25794.1 hypothetical protein HMPREF0519_0053 [Lentilactobacillus hilgardii DSM 20176 = ATCC 8290]KRK53550.1 hypothetical protein FD42_GL002059 [Lentilactobacillus hilgardii DSM 20176 = ATCC 8290]QEU39032.1 hypothetical protein LH500_09115 [Lentilactobacillus hilgardii]TDG78725.1 hypothetical protein C5L34_000310 [Lentilactobacillus hilgardii]